MASLALAASGATGCAVPASGEAPPDAALRGRISVPAGARTARIVRVVDGDTVVLRGLGSSRLIGIDTPEVYGHRECYGREASAFARRLLAPGSRVRYVRGVEAHDRYERDLVYLWLPDRRSVNAMLAEGGYATPLTIAPNDRYAPRFKALTRSARRHGWGLWGRRGCAR